MPLAAPQVLRKLVELTDADFLKILKSLQSIPDSTNVGKLAAHLTETAGVLDIDYEDFLYNIMSMNVARVVKDMLPAEFTQEVLNVYIERTKSVDHRPSLTQRLSQLLDIPALTYVSRAWEMRHEGKNIFYSARIFCDVRTVFDPKTMKPIGATIIHNLKIEYKDGGTDKELYFLLDTNELPELEDVIKRAKDKVKEIEALIKKSEIKYYE